MTITRRELANELKISIGGVDQYARSGMPLTSRYEALDWIVAHKQPQYGRNANKGVSLARKLVREGIFNTDTLASDPDDAALAACEAVLAPIATAVLQELARLGAHVADLVKGMDDALKIEEVAWREAKDMLARLSQLEVGHG